MCYSLGGEYRLIWLRVRPPNDAELSRDGTSVWDTPSWDDHLIKLARGKDSARDEREWAFGELVSVVGRELTLS